ncbi:hypothetical protein GJ496_002519 [Pomphorhynchus laevis]|nr:hypothetical protein GJ496_002519 [Pomphorhynchus laevis]KAI0990272.1 hypothetical protein GJ496_002519 [Pomphorhynchus laevis]
MNALTLGLGGRAQLTNRSNSASCFVQDGCNFSQIKIVLCNVSQSQCSRKAFMQDKFGSTITIIRKIANNQSQYRLLSDTGKLVSTKNDTLCAIRRHFSIELDNPICMLNQEQAKSFMSSISPTNFYQFFAKAAQFDKMSEMYKNSEIYINSMKTINNERKEMLKQLSNKLDKLNRIILQKQSVQQWSEKITSLKREFKSVDVVALHEECKSIESRISEIDDKIVNYATIDNESTINHMMIILNQLDQTLKYAKGDALNELNREREQLNSEISLHKQNENQLKFQICTINDKIAQRSREMTELEAEVQTREPSKFNPILLKTKQLNLDKVQNELDSLRKNRENDVALRTKWTDTRDDIVYKLNIQRQDARELSQRISNLKQGQVDKKKRYGVWIPQLLKRLNEMRSKFKQMPIGPIGLHVSVKADEWVVAVERGIQSLLEIIPSSVIMPSVIVTTAKSMEDYDIKKFRPKIKLPVMLDVLEFDDNRIGCVLIDQCRIDSNVLCSDRSSAISIIQSGLAAKTDVKKMFTKDGSEIIPGENTTFRLYACPHNVGSLLGSADNSYEIVKLEKEMSILNKSLSNLNDQLNQHKNEEIPDKLQKYAQNEQQLLKLKVSLTSEIEQITEEQNKSMNLDYKEYLTKEIQVIKDEIDELNSELREKNETFKQIEIAMKEFICQRENLKQKIGKQCEEIMHNKAKRQKILADIENKQSEQSDSVANLEKLKKQRGDMYERLTSAESNFKRRKEQIILEIGELVNTKRSKDTIQSEIAKAEGCLKACEKSLLSQDVHAVEQEAKRLTDHISEGYQTLQKDRNQIKILESALQKREQSLHIFQDTLSLKCSRRFTGLLKCRDFKGSLEFDHEQELLNVLVSNADSEKENRGRKRINQTCDLKSLSGGERSFSSVCFLLSMWDTVAHPFRCLDEFDVFMDQTNVEIVTAMLVEAAGREILNTRQFLFISPQGTCLASTDNIRILKMPNPKRVV